MQGETDTKKYVVDNIFGFEKHSVVCQTLLVEKVDFDKKKGLREIPKSLILNGSGGRI